MTIPHEALDRLDLKPADLRDPFLRRMQQRFDEEFFDAWPYALELKEFPDGSHVSHADAKVAHIGLHVGKALAKLDTVARGSGIRTNPLLTDEILPDILIYRTQLANTLRFDLQGRLGQVIMRSRSMNLAAMHLHAAHRDLVTFSEPLEHMPPSSKFREQARQGAIPALHMAGLVLANITGRDPHEAHCNRLRQHIIQQQNRLPRDRGL